MVVQSVCIRQARVRFSHGPPKKSMKKIISIISLLLTLVLPSVIFAHSTVSPSETATSKYETFTLSVPTEKDVPTVGIRLVVPSGVDRFTPFVKPGWTLNITKDANGNATEVEWKGGAIPADQKDIFQFTARTAPQNTTLIWKVYQTYQGGEVVSWDQDPKSSSEVKNPYSITEVKADTASPTTQSNTKDKLPLILSIVSLVISFMALQAARKK